jgi:hypothetical protein
MQSREGDYVVINYAACFLLNWNLEHPTGHSITALSKATFDQTAFARMTFSIAINKTPDIDKMTLRIMAVLLC